MCGGCVWTPPPVIHKLSLSLQSRPLSQSVSHGMSSETVIDLPLSLDSR